MGFFSKLFKKESKDSSVRKRPNNPDVVDVSQGDDSMNWAIEKANLTLHHFESCLKNPHESQFYFSIKVEIVDGNKNEHIWLTEPSFDKDGNLFGVVGNEPIDVTNVQMNQKIGIDRKMISDWMIIQNGRLIGGYTIRAIRDKLEGAALKNFDKGVGGMIIDSGEDYFLPNDSTPEGVIVKLEQAYNNDNLEQALSCKDFNKEAEIMLLSKIGNPEIIKSDEGKSLLKTTAEALKLSYIKMLQENGMPKLKGVKRAFPIREKITENHYKITEYCFYPDGESTVDKLNVHKINNSWKVVGGGE